MPIALPGNGASHGCGVLGTLVSRPQMGRQDHRRSICGGYDPSDSLSRDALRRRASRPRKPASSSLQGRASTTSSSATPCKSVASSRGPVPETPSGGQQPARECLDDPGAPFSTRFLTLRAEPRRVVRSGAFPVAKRPGGAPDDLARRRRLRHLVHSGVDLRRPPARKRVALRRFPVCPALQQVDRQPRPPTGRAARRIALRDLHPHLREPPFLVQQPDLAPTNVHGWSSADLH